MAKSWTIRKDNQIIKIGEGETCSYDFPRNEGDYDEVYKIECRDESGYTATLDYAIKPCSGPPTINITYKKGDSSVAEEPIRGFIFDTDAGKLRLDLNMRNNETSGAIITDGAFIGAVINSVMVIDSRKYSYKASISSTSDEPLTIEKNGVYTITSIEYETIELPVKYYLSFSNMEKGKLNVGLHLNSSTENVTVSSSSSFGSDTFDRSVIVNESLDPNNDYSDIIKVDLFSTTGELVSATTTYTLEYHNGSDDFRDSTGGIIKNYTYSHEFLDGISPRLEIKFRMGDLDK